jgi:hemin uptake protein HemP
MDTETTGAENGLPEQEAPRKPDKRPPIIMTSRTNLIQLQSELKEHDKKEYEFRNTRKGTHILTKVMAEYSATKSYLEKYNLQYFTFSPKS